jgi:hypothetical protein
MIKAEQAARNYAEYTTYGFYPEVEKAFIAGIEFAQQWEDIASDMPENVDLLIKCKNGKVMVGSRWKNYIVDKDLALIREAVYWRHIEVE